MEIERKAFKSLYKVIKNGSLNENEAYCVASAIFAVNFQYIPMPQMEETPFEMTSSSVQEEQPKPLEVAGFRMPEE